MLIGGHQHSEPVNRFEFEHVRDRRSSYALTAFVMMLTTLAFFPITQPADVVSMSLDASRILELGLLGLAAGVITLAILHHRCEVSFSSRAPLVAFLFCFWAMLSSIWSMSPILSFGRAGTLMLILYIAAALAVYARHMFGNTVRAISLSMTGALLGSVLLLLFVTLIIWGTPLKFEGANWYTGRAARLVLAHAGPLETGEFLSFVIIVAAVTIRRLSAKVMVFGVLFFLLFLTNSRNLMVFVPVALAAAWFHRGSTQLRFILISLLACGVLALIIFALSGDLMRALPADIATLNGRLPLWQFAGGIIAENPVLGVGYYASRYYLLDVFSFAGHAHNSYVETLMTTGLVGLSLLLGILVYCFKVGMEKQGSLLMAIVVLCCLGSIFDPLILTSNVYTFCLFVMLIVIAETDARQESRSDVRQPVLANSAVFRQ